MLQIKFPNNKGIINCELELSRCRRRRYLAAKVGDTVHYTEQARRR